MSDAQSTAWQELRRAATERATACRAFGTEAIVAFADHGTITDRDRPTLLFTVADDTADDVAASGFETVDGETAIRYTDADGVRLYLLECESDTTVVLVAGGVRHDRLSAFTDRLDEPARTVVRRADGDRVLRLDHDRLGPFLDGLNVE